MSNSFEFNIEITQEKEEEIVGSGSGSQIIYQAIEKHEDLYFTRVLTLQELVKSQSLLLQYEEKRKNERLKEIQYNYVNAFTNYLWTRCSSDRKDSVILLNPKDITTLHEAMPADMQQVFRSILGESALPFRNDLKPSPSFILDFMNFWPRWHQRVRQVIEMEIAESDRIEATFESEYTFAAKILSNLRLNDRIQRFCASIFEPVLVELEMIKEELVVDFSGIYEKWSEQLPKLPVLKRFLDGGEGESRTARGEIEQIFGKLKGEQQAQMLLDEMVHFERKETAISFLMAEVGEEQMPEGLNLRLAWLVWKKVLANRKKLQMLATGLLACIIEAYPRIPSEVKYVVRCFKEVSERHFGSLRFQDLKSFFNKVIFSQLFFAEFMNLYEARSQPLSNVNLTLLALVSQKIMFGQQFYEKFKFGFLNPIIVHYVSAVKQFILGFVAESIRVPPPQAFPVLLISLQSLKFVYESTRTESLQSLEATLCKSNSHTIANRSYPLKNIYVTLLDKPALNYTLILKPADKIKRILIEFLLLIEKISQKNSIAALFQQYRCAQEDPLSSKPSVQLQAIFLQQKLTVHNMVEVIDAIEGAIEKGKRSIEQMKINMEKQYNYSQNLEKMYLKLWKDQRKRASKAKIEAQIAHLLPGLLGFDYQVAEGKVCESSWFGNKTMQQCLNDIADSFLKGHEGVDGLYHMLLQRVVEELEKGVVPDEMMDIAKSIIGQKLYSILKLDTYMSGKDFELLKKMERHAFVTLAMLDLQYEQEEELIIKECGKLIEELGRPCCPDRLLNIFKEITLVFLKVIGITGKAADVNSDVQISLMLVTIIRSKVRNLVTLIDFVQKFCTDDLHSSALAQTFSCLLVVVRLIQQLDQTKLSISAQEYQKRTLNTSYVIIE